MLQKRRVRPERACRLLSASDHEQRNTAPPARSDVSRSPKRTFFCPPRTHTRTGDSPRGGHEGGGDELDDLHVCCGVGGKRVFGKTRRSREKGKCMRCAALVRRPRQESGVVAKCVVNAPPMVFLTYFVVSWWNCCGVLFTGKNQRTLYAKVFILKNSRAEIWQGAVRHSYARVSQNDCCEAGNNH